jgi:DNA-binding HxlR family transcriptional regulator
MIAQQDDDGEMECARFLLDRMADKWAIRIFWAFCPEMAPIRFNELKRRVGGISQKMLSQHLRQLERSGLLERRVLPGRILGVEYAITPLGLSLREPVATLYRWAEANVRAVRDAQSLFDERSQRA